MSQEKAPGLKAETRRRPDKAALVIAVILAGVAALILWDTRHIGAAASYARIGPAAFPYAIAAGLLILAIATAVTAWRGGFPKREADNIAPIIWIVGGLAAQMLLLKIAGFSIATGLMFAAIARSFGRGPLWMTIPIGIVLSFAAWLFFAKVLQLSLPAGPPEHFIQQLF
ncbi:MAG: tripartite tricarboxylate transporter TctB family protein [Rhodospirillaceae bacterium]|nr:MAG: tripartite tricarboxylate transporter TctB family protein [Rhodospirillaceae bacterium]